jgi:hypothetical protein
LQEIRGTVSLISVEKNEIFGMADQNKINKNKQKK